MNDNFLILNIREYLGANNGGEDLLRNIFSTYSCKINCDVERFFLEQSIEFTKKNQSVTYIVFTSDGDELLGYFTITIKPISVNGAGFSNTVKRKIARVSEQDADSGNYLLAAYLIAQLGKNFSGSADKKITGEQLLGLAIEKIKELQYMAGGMVVFLEAEDEPKLVDFYEKENGFKRFDTREVKVGTDNAHSLIQFLKVL
jgi:hypothetical protein